MTRIIVIVACFVAACDVGDASKAGAVPDGGGPKMDSGGGGNVDAPITAAHQHMTANQVPAGNTSNAGQGCMNANCHGPTPGPNAPTFAFAGTVYADANHTLGAPGVNVHAGGLTATTDSAGNFYAYSPPNLTLPCSTDVTTASMAAQLTTGGGNCNGGSCHLQPGGTQQGIYK
jgi:hypothetical protein